ncbi:hypothetical protein IKQ74_00380 [Candidatus Saccharibacteria bacterium]|nr:hypothetical protein [Candidatus Saccharibacteria bacterium]
MDKKNSTNGALCFQGFSDCMENQRTIAEQTATKLIQDNMGELAEGRCSEKIEAQISKYVDRLIEAVQWSPGAEEGRAFVDIVNIDDDDRLLRYLAIIRQGTEQQKRMLQKCLDDQSYAELACEVLDRIAALPDTAAELARKAALFYSGADERLGDAMMTEAKKRNKAV